ncbi:MAG: enoyl-CoA hydratase-related protein [Pseudomonadota bacterium]
MVEGAASIRIEDQGAVRIITIDREARSNALDAATSDAISRAVDDVENDPAIRVLVLTGAGDRAFCAGMDLKEAAARGAGHGLVPGRGFAGITERRRSKPLIVAANGAVVAGGFELALAADIVIAADHAVFGLAEVKRGLFAFAGGIQRLARSVPRATALHLILTGEPIGADRAFALGLVSEVVPAAQLMARALAVAQDIAAFDRDTVRRALALHDYAADTPIHESLSFGRIYGEETLGSTAEQEAIRAYAEGRAKP